MMAESNASSLSSYNKYNTESEARGASTINTSLIKMSHTYGQERKETYCGERAANLSTV